MGKFLFWICMLLFFCNSYNHAQTNVSFYEEHIDFTLDSCYFCINGIYSFCNVTDMIINQNIIFPFACKSVDIDSVYIVNLKTKQFIPFHESERSVNFSLMLPAKDSVDIHIYYRQKSATSNKYILTSTQSWGKPLEKAIYTLTVDDDIKIKHFSYNPDDVQMINKRKVYFWKKQDFMPETDFEVVL